VRVEASDTVVVARCRGRATTTRKRAAEIVHRSVDRSG
jgi:hypothetical protein